MIPCDVVHPIIMNHYGYLPTCPWNQAPLPHPWQPSGPGVGFGLVPPFVYRPLPSPPPMAHQNWSVDTEVVGQRNAQIVHTPAAITTDESEDENEQQPLDLSMKKEDGRQPLAPPKPNHVFGRKLKRPAIPEQDEEITVPIIFKKWKEEDQEKTEQVPKKRGRKQARPRRRPVQGSGAPAVQKKIPAAKKNVIVVKLGDGPVSENFEHALGSETWNKIVQEKRRRMQQTPERKIQVKPNKSSVNFQDEMKEVPEGKAERIIIFEEDASGK